MRQERGYKKEYFLAIDRELAYNELHNQVAESLQGLQSMPARTLNDFLAGFFMVKPEKV